MTDREVLSALELLGRERTEAHLARLRRSDLEAIALARGVRPRAAETPADIARRVVSVTQMMAERGARRAKRNKRASRS